MPDGKNEFALGVDMKIACPELCIGIFTILS